MVPLHVQFVSSYCYVMAAPLLYGYVLYGNVLAAGCECGCYVLAAPVETDSASGVGG